MDFVLKFINLLKTNVLLFCIKIIFFNNFKYSFLCFFKKNCSVRIRNDGKIHLGSRTSLNNNVELNSNGGFIELKGKNYINRNTIIASHKKIIIGFNTIIGPNVLIYDHDHDYRNELPDDKYISKEIIIGDNVWIGGGSIILKGVKIGDNSVIAAGSVITHNVESNTVIYQKKDSNSIKFI